MILTQIVKCITDFETTTGKQPTRLYLGRRETRVLGKWAYEQSYQIEDGSAAGEGTARPKVMGLPLYEVNDDEPHLACS